MRSFLVMIGMLCSSAVAQDTQLRAIDHFPLNNDGLAIRRHVETGKPFTVAGAQGVVLGQQEGIFEAWVLPVKLLSHFSIRAEVEGYSVPIDLNAAASEIEVLPDHTTITYSHIAFTVRQTMFAFDDSEEGTGAVVLFQVDSIRPMELTFSFSPEMRPMWPQMGLGTPSAEWVKQAGGGLYILHTDYPSFAGAVTMPGAQPGVMAPYQEKPQVHPLELKLHYDPKIDADRYFPLLMAVGSSASAATNAALQEKLQKLNVGIQKAYETHAARYTRMTGELTALSTPNAELNDDFSWAEMAIEQLKARARPSGETGLVAGYYSSGDSARPGFGWYFGRDTLYTLYAVNSFGDFKLTRDAMEFLIKHQRSDGKMMHEYSQTAASVPWSDFPYMYAAADATPLFLTAMLDYVRSSGDIQFLRENRGAVERAWRFETTHDSDGDGIYDNAQGTGWVESWPTGMPHQEIYLALLDQQGSAAMSKLSTLLDDKATSTSAKTRAEELTKKIELEYYDPTSQSYAFSRSADGTLDRAATIFPTVAWWNNGSTLIHAEASFRRWASHEFSTDWGLRDVAESDPVYDPISYHQGSVWPLFTGWTSMAEYRTGHTLSGYTHLMQTAEQTRTQDLGAVTELLSGIFFQPFGRSTSHQLWSSAMVVVPALRGLFGIEVDAQSGMVLLDPHLPADWDSAEVKRLHIGLSVCTLQYTRKDQRIEVKVETISGTSVHLATSVRGGKVAEDRLSATFLLPALEVSVPQGLPLPGARTSQMKVLDEAVDSHSLKLVLEGMAGSVVQLKLRRNTPKLSLHAEGAIIAGVNGGERLVVSFGSGVGYQQQMVTVVW